jgi:hypothetical protein
MKNGAGHRSAWVARRQAQTGCVIDAARRVSDNHAVHQTMASGLEFARALAQKDASRMRDLLHPEIDFRGMTPGRTWEANDPDGVVAIFLDHWFGTEDEIEAVDELDGSTFADRERVGYRFSVTCADGPFVVEQQAYISQRDGQIGWMRVLCSGFRAVGPE